MAKNTYKATLVSVSGRLEGMDTVLKNLEAEFVKIKNDITEKGLVLCAAKVRIDTEKIPPLTPVDTGNLRASWMVATKTGSKADSLGISGTFKNKPFKKAKTPVADLRGIHAAISTAAVVEAKGSPLPLILFGYTVNYATTVHEGPGGNMGARFQRSGAGIKWFEAAINRNIRNFVNIIRDNAKIR